MTLTRCPCQNKSNNPKIFTRYPPQPRATDGRPRADVELISSLHESFHVKQLRRYRAQHLQSRRLTQDFKLNIRTIVLTRILERYFFVIETILLPRHLVLVINRQCIKFRDFFWQVLEEIGIWSSVRRVAGASAGAMTAMLVAVGYNSYDIDKFLSQDIKSLFLGNYSNLTRFAVRTFFPSFTTIQTQLLISNHTE